MHQITSFYILSVYCLRQLSQTELKVTLTFFFVRFIIFVCLLVAKCKPPKQQR